MKGNMKIIKNLIITAILLLPFALPVQAQTNIIIAAPVMAVDHTAKISWNAEPGAVYQIESADSLTDTGSQGLKWIIRETDCASKGTNAEWMDVGSSQWIPRILPPRFQSARFYRVTKVKQATLTPPPTATLQLDQSNIVNGFITATMNLTYADTNQQMSSVKLFVDGQEIYNTTDESSYTYINSSEWPNGPHEIYAVATTVDTGETLPDSDDETETNAANFAIAVSPSQFVTFSNYISQFFVSTPFFDPAQGQTQEVVATFPEDTCWQLHILDGNGNSVREFSGQSSTLYAAWDGNDDSGNPTYYGFYDYYIQARPSQYGCLDGMSAVNSSTPGISVTASASSSFSSSTISRQPIRAQFNKLGGIEENVAIPSLNPTPPPPVAKAAIAPQRIITYDGTNELINGIPAVLYPQGFDEASAPRFKRDKMTKLAQPLDAGVDNWPDNVYQTDYPNRVPGNLFKGYAGIIGLGSQGHHPHSPSFPLPPGGVISASHPPYGRLVNATVIADNFSKEMVNYGWRTGFNLKNDNLNSTNLFPVAGAGSGDGTFAKYCHLGLLIGHMTATAYSDPDYYVTHSFYPVYNTDQPGHYQWIPLPGMDFGKSDGSSPLQWMGLYGCNSLRQQDFIDMWTKFELPMPPNLRLLLGSEEGVFLHPVFGARFADDLQNMSIINAWCDAASYADTQTGKGWLGTRWLFMGTRHMSWVYRDISQGGSWRTSQDTIWNWGSDISYDWFDVSFNEAQVYPTN
jgi:hypothetical protein